MERKINNKKPRKLIAIVLSSILILCSFSFLCSIRFRLDYYLLSTIFKTKGYFYHNYDDFDEHKNNFEILVNEIKCFVDKTPDFYSEYAADSINAKSSDGIHFVKKGSLYPNIIYDVYKPDTCDWEEVKSCLLSFPERGFDFIELDEKYPDYVFFPCSEYSPRIITYTGGEKPYKYINELWNKYEYVEVVKLGYGWYDIRPQGVK